ncbi:hypothetical protein CUMW_147690 [Citrus unshiu]|nr:hypothetical protein CUMW_147690 [Citrus unshiu]
MSNSSWRRLFFTRRFDLSRYFSSSSRAEVFDPPPLSPLRRVVVTGIGMVTPLGCGAETTWRRLIVGECGIREITPEDLKMGNFDRETQLHAFGQLTSKVAAVVPCGISSGEFNEDSWLNSKDHRSIARFIAYALCAADEALHDAKWLPSDQGQKERTRLRRLSPFFIPRILINMASGHVSMKYGFQGPNHAAVTACATGAHSIGDAARMIQFGDSDVMVAGGTESSIDALSMAGFCKSRALTTKYNGTPQEASRPFDCGRDGIGEGSGVLVLEELEHAKKRGAKIYAEVRGYGMSGDAHHITQPHIDGKGAILAMTRALKQSGLQSHQVDYVNAHATSTPLGMYLVLQIAVDPVTSECCIFCSFCLCAICWNLNSGDTVEATAIRTVFSDHATSGSLAFSSTKGAIGHLLGAAGAVEAIFAVLTIHHGVAPLTLNLAKPDPIFNDNFMPLTASKDMPISAALSNSFGFGGTNASLLFTKCQ